MIFNASFFMNKKLPLSLSSNIYRREREAERER